MNSQKLKYVQLNLREDKFLYHQCKSLHQYLRCDIHMH